MRTLSALEKLEANEEKQRRHAQAMGRCYHCHREISLAESELAHRIPAHKKYIKKYGEAVIYHRCNMDLTCSNCNHKSLIDPATHPVEAKALVEKITRILEEDSCLCLPVF